MRGKHVDYVGCAGQHLRSVQHLMSQLYIYIYMRICNITRYQHDMTWALNCGLSGMHMPCVGDVPPCMKIATCIREDAPP